MRTNMLVPLARLAMAGLLWLALWTPGLAGPAQSFDHRAGGFVFDAFALTDAQGISHQWTVGDGGRIRYRQNDDRWTFQVVPAELKDHLRRIFFLQPVPQPSGPDLFEGWAVGQNGALAYTDDGGTTWMSLPQIFDPNLNNEPADLYDIHFLPDAMGVQRGWLLSTKTLWHTANSGGTWTPAMVGGHSYSLSEIEYYSLDVVEIDGDLVGLACGEPGLVVRAQEFAPVPSSGSLLTDWLACFDIQAYCGVLNRCQHLVCNPPQPGVTPPSYEPWGIKILVNETLGEEMVLMSGGVGTACGLAFSSLDRGSNWARDEHECESHPTFCEGATGYSCSAGSTKARHCGMKTQYDVDGYPDGAGISVGYNGQHLVRTSGFVSPGVWEDRSEFASAFTVPDAVVYPLIGVAAYLDGQGERRSVATGSGGYIREDDGVWDDWENSRGATNHPQYNPDVLPHDPWRLRAVHFRNTTQGWRVGQFARISRSNDAGFTWDLQQPAPSQGNPYLNAIAFASDGVRGVTVGDVSTATSEPMVLYNDQVDLNPQWAPAASIGTAGSRRLLDVAWGGDTAANTGNFWAVGAFGLILMSDDNGETWNTATLPSPYDLSPSLLIELSGVAFEPATKQGLFVGKAHYDGTGGSSDPVLGVAYHRDASGNWSDIRPTDPTLATTLKHITAVAIDAASSTVWAVGQKEENGVVTGVILTGPLSSSGTLVQVATPAPIEQCKTGKDVGELPVLTAVEVAPGGDVWAGGSCGRLWLGSSGGSSWAEKKSHTSSHVRTLSFVPDGAGYAGFIGCHRDDENTTQAIVRIQQQP